MSLNIRFLSIASSFLIPLLSNTFFTPVNADDTNMTAFAEACWRREGTNGIIPKSTPKTCVTYRPSVEEWNSHDWSQFYLVEGAEFEISTTNLVLVCAEVFASSKSKLFQNGKIRFCKYGTGPKVKFDQDFSGSVSFTFIARDPKSFKIPYAGIFESRIVETQAEEKTKKLSEIHAQNVCNENIVSKGLASSVAVNAKPIILNNDYVAPPKPTNPVNAWANKMGGGQMFKVEVLCPREAELRVLFPSN